MVSVAGCNYNCTVAEAAILISSGSSRDCKTSRSGSSGSGRSSSGVVVAVVVVELLLFLLLEVV